MTTFAKRGRSPHDAEGHGATLGVVTIKTRKRNGHSSFLGWPLFVTPPGGVRYSARRQGPLLGFIADFYAPSARLIIEADGGYHERRMAADARRDRKLARAGYRVVRLSAELVIRDLAAALRSVRRALDEP